MMGPETTVVKRVGRWQFCSSDGAGGSGEEKVAISGRRRMSGRLEELGGEKRRRLG